MSKCETLYCDGDAGNSRFCYECMRHAVRESANEALRFKPRENPDPPWVNPDPSAHPDDAWGIPVETLQKMQRLMHTSPLMQDVYHLLKARVPKGVTPVEILADAIVHACDENRKLHEKVVELVMGQAPPPMTVVIDDQASLDLPKCHICKEFFKHLDEITQDPVGHFAHKECERRSDPTNAGHLHHCVTCLRVLPCFEACREEHVGKTYVYGATYFCGVGCEHGAAKFITKTKFGELHAERRARDSARSPGFCPIPHTHTWTGKGDNERCIAPKNTQATEGAPPDDRAYSTVCPKCGKGGDSLDVKKGKYVNARMCVSCDIAFGWLSRGR